jgi:hypothetical protein
MNYSSALSIPKGAPIEGIRILVNVWIIMKVYRWYHRQAVTTSVKDMVNNRKMGKTLKAEMGRTSVYSAKRVPMPPQRITTGIFLLFTFFIFTLPGIHFDHFRGNAFL